MPPVDKKRTPVAIWVFWLLFGYGVAWCGRVSWLSHQIVCWGVFYNNHTPHNRLLFGENRDSQ
jgi:hypothetical protein